MKSLEQLINVEKARLLHQLFPDEIPGLLQFVKSTSVTIQESKDQIQENWQKQNGFSFEEWLTIAKDIENRIKHYGNKLAQSCSLFSDQLFDGNNCLFMMYCLGLYTRQRQHINEKFTQAVNLFFGNYIDENLK